jgi:hypothetical protein
MARQHSGRQLDELGSERECPQQANEDWPEPEVDRPRGQHAARGARADDLGKNALDC